MSLRFVINIDTETKSKCTHEIEFWPDRQRAQAREITHQGVVTVDREMDLKKVVDGLLGAIKESREEKQAEAFTGMAMGALIDTTTDRTRLAAELGEVRGELEEARALIERLEDEKEKLIVVAHAAFFRTETYYEGECRTKRDSYEEWASLKKALIAAGYAVL